MCSDNDRVDSHSIFVIGIAKTITLGYAIHHLILYLEIYT